MIHSWNYRENLIKSNGAVVAKSATPLKIGLIGTSLVQGGTYSHQDGTIGSFARSWIDWASFIGNGAIEVLDVNDPVDYPGWSDRKFIGTNFGVGSQFASEIYRRIPNVIKNRHLFDVVIVDMGTNDITGTTTTKEEIHELRVKATEDLVKAGFKVILLTILARSTASWASNSPQRKKANWVNQKSRDYFRDHKDVIVYDWNIDWVDVTSADGNPVADYTNDGIHFTPRGAYSVGKGLWDRVLSKMLPSGVSRITSPDDKFDATYNPLGVVNSNPMFIGTGGTAGTGVTGSVPASITVERATGSNVTVVSSIVNKGVHEGNNIRLTFTLGGTADETFYVRTLPVDSAHSLAGKWVQPFVTFSTTTAADTIKAIKLVLIDQANTNNKSENFKDNGTYYFPASAISQGQLIGRPIKLLSNSTNCRIRVEIIVNGAGTVAPVIEISKMGFRQVELPVMYKPDNTLFTP